MPKVVFENKTWRRNWKFVLKINLKKETGKLVLRNETIKKNINPTHHGSTHGSLRSAGASRRPGRTSETFEPVLHRKPPGLVPPRRATATIHRWLTCVNLRVCACRPPAQSHGVTNGARNVCRSATANEDAVTPVGSTGDSSTTPWPNRSTRSTKRD